MSPAEEARRLEACKTALMASYLKDQPDALEVGLRALQAAAKACRQPITFAWREPTLMLVENVPVRRRPSKGLICAWMCLVRAQHGLPPLEAAMFFPDHRAPGKCALQAIKRAARGLDAQHPRLAAVLLRIGVVRGQIVLKSPAPEVNCTSNWLRRLVGQMPVEQTLAET